MAEVKEEFPVFLGKVNFGIDVASITDSLTSNKILSGGRNQLKDNLIQ